MSQKEFNEFLSDYLDSKSKAKPQKKKKHLSPFKKKKKQKRAKHEDLTELSETRVQIIEKDEKPLMQRLAEWVKGVRTKKASEPLEEGEDIDPEVISKQLKKEKVSEQEFDSEDEEIKEEIEESPSFWKRMKMLFSSEDKNIPEETDQGEINVLTVEEYKSLEQDLKHMAQFTVQIIKSLPRRKIEDLKESRQFKEFKEILKKRSLIKEENQIR